MTSSKRPDGDDRRRSAFRGSLVGLAVGDAMGAAIEFCDPGTFAPVTEYRGGGPFDLEPGQWTDDTSMALCLAESLCEKNGFDPVDQLQRYVLWFREGHLSSTGFCFDIGGTTQAALQRFEKTREPWCGPTDPRSAGNGSIMRLAPVPLFFSRDPVRAMDLAADSSRTTHGARTALDACRYMAGIIAGAVRGDHKDILLSAHYTPAPGYWDAHPLHPEIDEIARGSFKTRIPPEIKGSGYVVKSLEAALWALYRTATFEEGLLLAVNLGDDADTTGAVYGQIAGAIYGEAGIPQLWRDLLTHRELVEGFADRLWEMRA
jgi:ADP-ribosylglycohydrolase